MISSLCELLRQQWTNRTDLQAHTQLENNLELKIGNILFIFYDFTHWPPDLVEMYPSIHLLLMANYS